MESRGRQGALDAVATRSAAHSGEFTVSPHPPNLIHPGFRIATAFTSSTARFCLRRNRLLPFAYPMSTLIAPMVSPTLKRPCEDEPPSQNAIDMLSQQGEDAAMVRASSPLSTLSTAPSKAPTTTDPADMASSGAPPSKKRKLTAAEKEAARLEKEKANQEKAAQKLQKEEERRTKLEEKRTKDEEKEEKRRVRDAEKAAKEQERKDKQDKKDAERKAKEDGLAKKERSQMRLTGFFGKPKADSPEQSPASSRRGSIASVEGDESTRQTPTKPGRTVMFLPFEPPSNSTVAPHNRFERDLPALNFTREQLDASLSSNKEVGAWTETTRKRALDESFCPPVKRRRYVGSLSVKDLITAMQGTRDAPVDLTVTSQPSSVQPLNALSRIPIKQFKYKEDVRPPYIGTYTKAPDGRSIKSFSRKPFSKALPKVDYDYDSEAEWEEPEEGEDLVSEADEEPDEDDAEEMDGFLDDEGADSDARRRHVADVPPLQTDMHWESNKRKHRSDIVTMGDGELDLGNFRIEALLEEEMSSIDPFSPAYWQKAPKATSQDGSVDQTSNMAPPRLPLSLIPGAANIAIHSVQQDGSVLSGCAKVDPSQASRWNTLSGITVVAPGKSKAGRPPAPPMAPELLDDFKAAILQYKDLTKVGLIEVLKKKFPGVSKVTVAETLEQSASRVGTKQADKHWELKV